MQQKQLEAIRQEQTRSRLSNIQAALCVPVTGIMDDATRGAIRSFNQGENFKVSKTDSEQLTQRINDLADAVRFRTLTIVACKEDGYVNGFEAGVFGYMTPDSARTNQVQLLLGLIKAKFPNLSVNETGGIADLRKAIGEIRPNSANKALDPDLLSQLMK